MVPGRSIRRRNRRKDRENVIIFCERERLGPCLALALDTGERAFRLGFDFTVPNVFGDVGRSLPSPKILIKSSSDASNDEDGRVNGESLSRGF